MNNFVARRNLNIFCRRRRRHRRCRRQGDDIFWWRHCVRFLHALNFFVFDSKRITVTIGCAATCQMVMSKANACLAIPRSRITTWAILSVLKKKIRMALIPTYDFGFLAFSVLFSPLSFQITYSVVFIYGIGTVIISAAYYTVPSVFNYFRFKIELKAPSKLHHQDPCLKILKQTFLLLFWKGWK